MVTPAALPFVRGLSPRNLPLRPAIPVAKLIPPCQPWRGSLRG